MALLLLSKYLQSGRFWFCLQNADWGEFGIDPTECDNRKLHIFDEIWRYPYSAFMVVVLSFQSRGERRGLVNKVWVLGFLETSHERNPCCVGSQLEFLRLETSSFDCIILAWDDKNQVSLESESVTHGTFFRFRSRRAPIDWFEFFIAITLVRVLNPWVPCAFDI